MSELSQAERTVMEAARGDWTPAILQRDAISGFEAGWLAARDYGRERERTLQEENERLGEGMDGLGSRLNDAETDRENAERHNQTLRQAVSSLVEELAEPAKHRDLTQRLATVEVARALLSASPGEPGVRLSDEQWATAVKEAQSDHGPGEPSEEEGRFFADRLLAEQFHATLPDPHRWRIRDLPTGGYLLVGESNG